jgi:hypothetical protein
MRSVGCISAALLLVLGHFEAHRAHHIVTNNIDVTSRSGSGRAVNFECGINITAAFANQDETSLYHRGVSLPPRKTTKDQQVLPTAAECPDRGVGCTGSLGNLFRPRLLSNVVPNVSVMVIMVGRREFSTEYVEA